MGRRPGPPVVYQRRGSTVYWCRFTVKERRYRLPTGQRDEGAAREVAEQLCAEITLGRRVIRPQTPTRGAPGDLETLVMSYLAAARALGRAPRYVESQLKHFNASFFPRWRSVQAVTSQSIEALTIERSKKVSSVTLAKELTTLSMFLKWAKAQGHITEVPGFERVKAVSGYQPTDLTRPQVDALLAKLPDRHTRRQRYRHPVREFYTVIWALALRLGEAQQMRWN